jgi:hypothetical protein
MQWSVVASKASAMMPPSRTSSKALRALRNPSLDLIVKLADHLKTTPGKLLTPPKGRS